MSAQVVQHIGKIVRIPCHETVAHAGDEHQLGKCRYHFLAADPDLYPLAVGQTDVVAPFLMEPRKQLVVGLPLHVQPEHIPRLNRFKALAALLAPEAQRVHEIGKRRVGGGNIRVDLDDVGLVVLCQRTGGVNQLTQRLMVVRIADRPAAAVEHRIGQLRHTADQHRHGALDLPIVAAAYDRPPDPHRLLLRPGIALRKMPLWVALIKIFKFLQGGFIDEFGHFLSMLSFRAARQISLHNYTSLL